MLNFNPVSRRSFRHAPTVADLGARVVNIECSDAGEPLSLVVCWVSVPALGSRCSVVGYLDLLSGNSNGPSFWELKVPNFRMSILPVEAHMSRRSTTN